MVAVHIRSTKEILSKEVIGLVIPSQMTITDGVIPVLGGSAVARDLKSVLDKSESFHKYAKGKTVSIRLYSSFVLEVLIS